MIKLDGVVDGLNEQLAVQNAHPPPPRLPISPPPTPCVYAGPFPPLDCPNLHTGIDYVGCYEATDLAWTYADRGPNGTCTVRGDGV